ncbi:hypothetical protein BGZ47_009958, partial [Haplosporangium gracile]
WRRCFCFLKKYSAVLSEVAAGAADGSVADEPVTDEFVAEEPGPDESAASSADESFIAPADETFSFLGLPFTPKLPSRSAKRLNVSGQMVLTPSEEGIMRLSFEFGVPSRNLGIRNAPSQVQPSEGLLSLLADSPFRGVLSSSTWIEFPRCQRLSEEWDNIISGCWVANPLLNYATAALFAGCVLFDPRSRNAVLCLVAESYGRGVDVDVHCEKAIPIGESVSTISQPSTSGLYPHATVCGIQRETLDRRLVLGCKNFNILFTEILSPAHTFRGLKSIFSDRFDPNSVRRTPIV